MRPLRFLPAAAVLTGLLLAWGIMAQAQPPVRTSVTYQPDVVAGATGQHGWRWVRNTRAATNPGAVTADDAATGVTTQTWGDTVNNYVNLDPSESTITLSFFAYGDGDGVGNPASGTVDVNVFLVEPYGSWEKIASVSLTVGDLQLSHNPVTGAALDGSDPNYKWCDGAGTDNLNNTNAWPTPVRLSGSTDGIFRLSVDTLGAQALVVRYDNIASLTRIYGVVKGR